MDEILVERCAGLDVHRDSVVATVRAPADGKRVQQTRTFSSSRAAYVKTKGTHHDVVKRDQWRQLAVSPWSRFGRRKAEVAHRRCGFVIGHVSSVVAADLRGS